MQVIFCSNNKPFALLIRLVTWSKWHHAGVIDGDEVIHARAFKGVVVEKLEDVKKRYPNHKIRELLGVSESARSEVGKKYDWSAIFGHPFNRWDDPKRWYCFELVAKCSPLFDSEHYQSIDGNDLYELSEPL